jgi:type II secretory pathway pseudopilin PulG
LVIVVVVIGIIASIAISRVGAAVANSRIATVQADLGLLNKAADMYAAEHDGRGPATEPDGSTDADSKWLIGRLVNLSDSFGNVGPGLPFGPYLLAIPKNPMTGLDTIRIDGPAAGRNVAGWRFDSASGTFLADDSAASASITVDGVSRTTSVNELDSGDLGSTGP